MRAFIFILFLTFWAAAQATECIWFYQPADRQQSNIHSALVHQLGDLDWHNDQAVFYDGVVQKDGRMKLIIPDGAKHWGTFYDGLFNPNTLHGDPRHPMAIMGPRLSYLMGYEVRPLNSNLRMNGPIEIISPGVELTQKTLQKINEVLAHEKKELIGLTIKKAGLVNEEDGLRLMLDTPKDVELNFPFHDSSKDLTPHEESYHKTFMIPRDLVRRARNINHAVLGFHDLLKRKGLNDYAESIKDMRWEETDYASAIITTTLAEFNAARIGGTLTRESASMHTEKLAELLTIWFRPELSAFESLVQYMSLFDPKLRSYLQKQHPRWVENIMDPKNLHPRNGPEFVGSHYEGSDGVYPMIATLLKEYEITLKAEVRPALQPRRSAQVWAENMLLNHENRILEITAALETVLKAAGVSTATQLFSDVSR